MADEADLANTIEERHRDLAIKNARAADNGPPSTGICRGCCQPIEPERLAITRTARHCADCANEIAADLDMQRRRGPR
jgi:RNA polymerase-binding transcription factor DksA